MTLAIDLPPELAQELAREAAREGQSLSDYALQVLQRSLRTPDDQAADLKQDGEEPPSEAPPRRPEGLAEGVVIVGPRFDEPLPREIVAKFGL